jgi:KUP system potassium uptake protein
MAITTLLAYQVERHRWRWPAGLAVLVTAFFLVIDFAFLGANLFKIADGGWVPLAMAAAILTMMLTWKQGRAILSDRVSAKTIPLAQFMGKLRSDTAERFASRVPGTAVYMSSTPDVAPLALMYNVKYNHIVHDFTVILTVRTDDTPFVPEAERVWLEPLGEGFWRLHGVYGFMEDPDVAKLLAQAEALNPSFRVDLRTATFFLGHETILSVPGPGMARWRERVFGLMARNAANATNFFNLPADRVVQLGAHIEI